MILSKVSIVSSSEKRIYKEYKFNEVGVNIILGQQSVENDETNGVGKTALVELIRYCLSQSLPVCFKHKIQLAQHNLHVVLEVHYKGKNRRIRRSLFNDKLNAYTDDPATDIFSLIDWEPIPLEDYLKFIQEMMYEDVPLNDDRIFPAFASVREYLMRDEKSGFTDIILPQRSASESYKILAFLSMIPYNFESELTILKNEIKKLKTREALINNIGKEIKQIQTQHDKTLQEIETLKKILNEVSISDKIQHDKTRYLTLKNQIDRLQQKIRQLEFAKQQHQKNIQDLESNLKKAKEFIDLKSFYQQIMSYFPDQLSKSYEEMVLFYQFMLDNRGDYFKKQIEKIDDMLMPIYSQQESYLVELSEVTSLLKGSELITDLQQISDQIANRYKELGEYQYKIALYKERENIKAELNRQTKIFEELTEKYNEVFAKTVDVTNNTSKHFNQLVNVAYNETSELQYHFEESTKLNATTGRIKIKCNIADEDAHGRFLMKINLFDIALLFNRVDKKGGLLFLAHDGSYSKITVPEMKAKVINYIDQYLKKAGRGQYFLTLNEEELTDQICDDFDKVGAIIAVLQRTDDDSCRCMGIKYSNSK